MKPTMAKQCAAAEARARLMYSSGSRSRSSSASASESPAGHVADQRIVGRRLVGDHVGLEAAPKQLRHDLGRVRAEADAERAALALCRQAALDRVVEIVGELVEIAGLEAALDPLRIDLDAERDAVVHRHRQRLGAAHPAESGGQRDRPGERAAEAAAGDLGEALVGPLDDPLAADVDPRAGGHLPVHRQPELPRGGGTRPSSPTRRPGSSSRSAPAAPTRGCERRRPACPTGPAASRRRRAGAARGRSRRRPPRSAPRGRCRRRRRGRRAARRRRGRGCSSASAAPPPAASRGS